MVEIIDTHIHLYDERITKDLNTYLKDNFENNVIKMFNTADSFKSFDEVLDLANKHKGKIYAILGIHPETANFESDEYLNKSFAYIKEHVHEIVAIGEIGLDYHYEVDQNQKERQKYFFIKQIELARELNLPIVVHSRDAANDTFEIISKYCIGMKVDLHCYSSSLEMAKRYISIKDLIIYFGIGGVLTFKNSVVLKEVVKNLDLKYFLSETDAPYLAPTPYRGKLNYSKYIELILEEIANIKNLPYKAVQEQINLNAKEFFNV